MRILLLNIEQAEKVMGNYGNYSIDPIPFELGFYLAPEKQNEKAFPELWPVLKDCEVIEYEFPEADL